MENALIILDRDGILNKLIVRDNGELDSPMSLNEIEVFPWIPEQLNILNKELKYEIAIATNQPAAAKGKISTEELEDIQLEISIKSRPKCFCFLDEMICFHRSEDNCECRKPKTKMLEYPFKKYNNFRKKYSWMVGDRAKDIIAGFNTGLNTALLAAEKEEFKILEKMNITPTYCGNDLRDFVEYLKKFIDKK